MRKRRIAIAVVVVLGLLATAGYAVASSMVYDEISKVSGDCPTAWADNDPTGFEVLNGDGTRVAGHETFDTSDYRMPTPEAVRFPSRDPGIDVDAWFIRSEAADAPAIVVVHGVDACKRDYTVLLPAGMLYRNGFSVLMIDLRDHGDSTYEDGRYAGGTEEYAEVLGAWDWLQEAQGIPAERIGIYGASLGAATALIAFGHEPGMVAIWEDSSYADLNEVLADELTRVGYPTFLRTGAVIAARLVSNDDIMGFSPLNAVERLAGRPIYITHGTLDDRIKIEYAEDLVTAAKAAGSTPETWFVPCGHTKSMLDEPMQYEQRLSTFFRETLGG
ncbi:MAG TPA: prolyl oligopeptidase family serine peptidase [Candidatus Limnocylindrales bacterium]|nr:prolyl oligopeptidase family serine peptidase [Candidatus Limnocylindrales bacterium]